MRFAKEHYALRPGEVIQPQLLLRLGDAESNYDAELNLYKVGWTTDDTDVAQVTANGTVTAVGYGTTQLVVKSFYLSSPVTAGIGVLPEAVRLDAERYVVPLGTTVRPQLLLTEDGKETATENRFGITWSVADERIATVAPDGTVKGTGYGQTMLTGNSPLLDPDVSAVIAVEPEKLRFGAEQYVLDVGGSTRPRLLVTEGGEEREAGDELPVTWRIADPQVASLAADHTVTGVRGGVTTLTVTSPYYPQEVTTQIIVRGDWSGEWMLSLWDGSDALAGRIYMNIADDGTFALYQNLDLSGFAVFRGTYSIADENGKSILSGVYDDGVPWQTNYYLSRNGDDLLLTSLSDGLVSQYVRTAIPDYVKDGVTAKAAALRAGFRRFL